MSGIASFKDKLEGFYAQFGTIINICVRFLIALVVFLAINREIGGSTFFTNIFVILIMALLSSILNLKAVLFFAAVLTFGNCMSFGIDIAAISLVLMLLLWVIFVIFVPDEAHAVIFAPLGILLGIPAFVPVAYGLKRTPASIAAVWAGIIMHYFIAALGANAGAIIATETGEYMTRITLISGAMTKNGELVANLIASAIIIIIVYAIRSMSADHSWQIAAVTGVVIYVVIAVLAAIAVGEGANFIKVGLGAAVSLVLAFVFLIFVHNVDYKNSESYSFEDDDYYYYVKAIPKVKAMAGPNTDETLHADRMEPDVDMDMETGPISDYTEDILPEAENLEKKLEDTLKEW